MTPWGVVERALNGMLERRWYTNHGPMAQALEARAAQVFEVRHAVAVANPTIGLAMLLEALAMLEALGRRAVLVPPGARARCYQAVQWVGLEAVTAMGPDVFAVLCSPADTDQHWAGVAASGKAAFLTDGLGGHLGPALVDLPAWGDDAGVACVTTDDDGLAGRLRNIRSSYGAGPPVAVVRTVNGRVSEIQAAMALHALG